MTPVEGTPFGSGDGGGAGGVARVSAARVAAGARVVRRYGLLVLAVAVFTGSLLMSFDRIQRQHGLDLTLSRLNFWFASQADVELQRLLRAVDALALGHADVDELRTRFENLRARLPALADRTGAGPPDARGEAAALVPELIARLDALEPLIDLVDRLDAVEAPIGGSAPTADAALRRLREGLTALEPSLGALTIAMPARLDDELARSARETGRYTWPLFSLLGILTSGGVFVGLLLREAGRARRAQREAREALAQLKAVIDAVPAMIGVVDRDHRYRLINRLQARFHGLDEHEAVGWRLAALDRDGERLNRHVLATKRPIPFQEEARFDHRGRERIWLTTRVPVFNAGGDVAQVVSVSLDITERKRAEARIEYLAHHDPLTDLPNRLLFRDRLDSALSRGDRFGGVFALHCIDLDRFKEINDTLGHAGGDALLRAAARRMQRCLREVDTLARLGGDEFAVIQTDIGGASGAAALAQRLVRSFHQPITIDGHAVVVGASIGVALFPRDGTDAEGLLRNADAALYEAKTRGRDAFCFFAGRAERAPAPPGSPRLDLHRAVAGEALERARPTPLQLPTRPHA